MFAMAKSAPLKTVFSKCLLTVQSCSNNLLSIEIKVAPNRFFSAGELSALIKTISKCLLLIRARKTLVLLGGWGTVEKLSHIFYLICHSALNNLMLSFFELLSQLFHQMILVSVNIIRRFERKF